MKFDDLRVSNKALCQQPDKGDVRIKKSVNEHRLFIENIMILAKIPRFIRQ